MTKYRPKFDDHNVNFKTLKTMTEEDQLSSLAIPLGESADNKQLPCWVPSLPF